MAALVAEQKQISATVQFEPVDLGVVVDRRIRVRHKVKNADGVRV